MDLRPLLERIEAPTLVLAGELDPFGRADSGGDRRAPARPDAVTVAGADHFAFLEPDVRAAWSRPVLDFLG